MCNCSDSSPLSSRSRTPVVPAVPSSITPTAPLASVVLASDDDAPSDLATPIPPIKLCKLNFRDGCYEIRHRPFPGLGSFHGTLRVDRVAPDGGSDGIIVSGDFYTVPPVSSPGDIAVPAPAAAPGERGHVAPAPAMSVAAAASSADAAVPLIPLFPKIPILPRARYHSYLKVVSVSAPIVVPAGRPCQLTLVADQFNYTQPPAGQHLGAFPSNPSRTVTIKLTKVAAPFPYSLTGGPYYEGSLFAGGVDRGSVTLAWVSPFFRRATLEIDTLTGAVPPVPVPDGSGGTEFFDTVFAKIGWQLSVVKDQLNVPVPAGVTPTNCWSSAALHSLMTTVRNPATNLDAEWRVHLVVVPAKLGCSRGVMYDQIGVPREGCATFCDDGYPTSDSSNFGAAANKKQRNIPRAYLRSATHEVTHTFNQIHQESETVADNSIMTTTPSVADVLGGPATGAPGVFPDQINLGQNTTVRHHLNHMPDPVIRPGGWPFASWFPTGAPQAADRHQFDRSELELVVTCAADRVALGQPVEVSWTLTNSSAVPLVTPNDVSIEALFGSIAVTDGQGRERAVRPFTILCESAALAVLEPGASVSASSRVYWSSEGFAFERPGPYRVTVAVTWSADGVPVAVTGAVDLFVDYPLSDADNQAVGLVMHPEVGKWVALGGEAYHLPEATRRLFQLTEAAASRNDGPPARLLSGFADLLPDPTRVAALHPEMVVAAPAAARPTASRARARKTTRRKR